MEHPDSRAPWTRRTTCDRSLVRAYNPRESLDASRRQQAKGAVAGQPAKTVNRLAASGDIDLPVMPTGNPSVRKSKMGLRRAAVLIGVHVLMIAHFVQWKISGTTLSPIEPSEAQYTLNQGELNAGFIFFAGAILATLVLGRFVCGWACHLLAYQDLAAWLLRKMRIRPKPFRSRMLILAPLAVALYMFVWPTAYRLLIREPAPSFSNHIKTAGFWDTFPGPMVAIATVVVCGFAIIYFLGSKGFCTYACPYGGFFAPADRLAIGRIRVTDACQHCGHCTSACTSNVRVHEEVARFGMVVDPGCMKCMDCVSVCPNDALYFGFGRPATGAKPKQPGKRIPYDFAWAEEISMLCVGVAALLALRGLYDLFPLLFSVGLAGMTGFAAVKLARLAYHGNERLQNLSLKRGGRVTRAGIGFAIVASTWLTFVAHGGFVQYHGWQGRRLLASLPLGDEIWHQDAVAGAAVSGEQLATLDLAIQHLQRARAWGLGAQYNVLRALVPAHLARNRVADAERIARELVERFPNVIEAHHGLGGVLRREGMSADAESAYRQALALDPGHEGARTGLLNILAEDRRADDAVAVYEAAVEARPEDADLIAEFGNVLFRIGRSREADTRCRHALSINPDHEQARMGLAMILYDSGKKDQALALFDEARARAPQQARPLVAAARFLQNIGEADAARASLEAALQLEPDHGDAHLLLGDLLIARRQPGEAIDHLEEAVRLLPRRAYAHYALGRAHFLAGRHADALPHLQTAVDLEPHQPEYRELLAQVLLTLGQHDRAKALIDDNP